MCLTGHQGNANRNRHEPSPQTCQNGHRQKTSDPQCWRGCGATGPPRAWRDRGPVQALWGTVCAFRERLKNNLP